jgi:hypothetical protein
LAYEERHTGYGELASTLGQVATVSVASIGRRKEPTAWRH